MTTKSANDAGRVFGRCARIGSESGDGGEDGKAHPEDLRQAVALRKPA